MPIHDALYRRLEISPSARDAHPIRAIAHYGARYSVRGWFTKLVIFASWLPMIFVGVGLYLISRNQEKLLQFVNGMNQSAYRTLQDVEPELIYQISSNLVFFILTVVQGFFAVLLTGLVGSHQIADDLKSNAFEVYLARPITALDYLCGKVGAVMVPLLKVQLIPVVLMIVLGMALIPESISASWSLLPKTILGGVLISLVHALVILGISSLGKSSRYATVIWFVLYFVSMIVSAILTESTGDSRFEFVSFRANIQVLFGEVIALVPISTFNAEAPSAERSVWVAALILSSLAALGALLVLRRLKRGRLP